MLNEITGTCSRCGKPRTGYAVSLFDNQEICYPCRALERQHTQYQLASAAVRDAYRSNKTHFTGIGLPAELNPYLNDEQLPPETN